LLLLLSIGRLVLLLLLLLQRLLGIRVTVRHLVRPSVTSTTTTTSATLLLELSQVSGPPRQAVDFNDGLTYNSVDLVRNGALGGFNGTWWPDESNVSHNVRARWACDVDLGA